LSLGSFLRGWAQRLGEDLRGFALLDSAFRPLPRPYDVAASEIAIVRKCALEMTKAKDCRVRLGVFSGPRSVLAAVWTGVGTRDVACECLARIDSGDITAADVIAPAEGERVEPAVTSAQPTGPSADRAAQPAPSASPPSAPDAPSAPSQPAAAALWNSVLAAFYERGNELTVVDLSPLHEPDLYEVRFEAPRRLDVAGVMIVSQAGEPIVGQWVEEGDGRSRSILDRLGRPIDASTPLLLKPRPNWAAESRTASAPTSLAPRQELCLTVRIEGRRSIVRPIAHVYWEDRS
jgi:hypothetical protein